MLVDASYDTEAPPGGGEDDALVFTVNSKTRLEASSH